MRFLLLYAAIVTGAMFFFVLGASAGRSEKFGPCPWCERMYEVEE